MKDLSEIFLCICTGLAIACAVVLAIRLESEKAEKRRAVEELNEARVMAEWNAFEDGRE